MCLFFILLKLENQQYGGDRNLHDVPVTRISTSNWAACENSIEAMQDNLITDKIVLIKFI
jgi:hypothetical protein